MTKRSAIGILLLGLICFVCGAIGARVFYKFPMGVFEVTFWSDVLIFSVIAVVGLALTMYSALRLRRSK